LAEVLSVVVQMALGILVPWWIVRRDLRHCAPERTARAWNDASFWSAIIAFGPLCIPVHFIRTRRSWWSLFEGTDWMMAAMAAIALPIAGLEALIST
jgi:hypothetical protein